MRPNVIFGYSGAIPYLGDTDAIQSCDVHVRPCPSTSHGVANPCTKHQRFCET